MPDIPELVRQAQGFDDSAEAAAEQLVEIGADALPEVCAAFEDSWDAPVGMLPNVVRRINDSRAVSVLVEHIRSESIELSQAVMQSLGASDDARAVAPLADLLGDDDEIATLRAAAAEALGDLTDGRQHGLFVATSREAHDKRADGEEWPDLAIACCVALAKLGDHGGFPMVAQFLDDQFVPTRSRATQALELVVGAGMVAMLRDQLSDDDAEVRAAAVDPLFLLGLPESITALASIVDDEEDMVASAAHVRLADLLGVEVDDDATSNDVLAQWSRIGPAFRPGVCHRLGRPLHIGDLIDLLNSAAPWQAERISSELRTITGERWIPSMNAPGVARPDLEDGILYKWGYAQDLRQIL